MKVQGRGVSYVPAAAVSASWALSGDGRRWFHYAATDEIDGDGGRPANDGRRCVSCPSADKDAWPRHGLTRQASSSSPGQRTSCGCRALCQWFLIAFPQEMHR